MEHFLKAVCCFFLFNIFTTLYSQQYTNNKEPLEDNSMPLLPRYTDQQYQVIRTDFTISLRDNVIIDAVKFVPIVPHPQGGWPTVIMVHGYGGSKQDFANNCQQQASFGYYAMTFSMRGQGVSGGLSNLISTTEAQDMIEIVNWVKSDTANGSNPGNMVITGGSQGGLVPFMAACLGGMNVKTMVSSLAPPNFASSWIENGCIKMTFLWTVTYPSNIARYNSLVDRMSNWVFANNKNKWDSLAYWLPINRDFMNIVQNNTIPVVVEGSWQDKFFNASGIINETTHLNVPFIMYLGALPGHGGDISPAENQWHAALLNDWYDYWLFGVQNGILNRPKYQFASTTFPVVNSFWTFVHDSSTVWAPPNISTLKLYFNRRRELTLTPDPVRSEYVTLENRITGGLTMLEAVNLGFQGTVFNSKFKRSQEQFNTGFLTQDVKLVGVPKVNLQYSSTAGPFAQYNFQIYEVMADGSQRLVNRINYTDRNYTPNTLKSIGVFGQGHSHIFKAGNKIRIVVTNLDYSVDDSLGILEGNPYVLPVLITGDNKLHLTSESYIELPVEGGSFDFASGEDSPVSSNMAEQYVLNQNYPNPFNPSTTINYIIAVEGIVKIKVFDITGREVKTLVDGYQKAGEHSVVFNAQNLASGIYFYKIESAEFVDIKKMILIK